MFWYISLKCSVAELVICFVFHSEQCPKNSISSAESISKEAETSLMTVVAIHYAYHPWHLLYSGPGELSRGALGARDS